MPPAERGIPRCTASDRWLATGSVIVGARLTLAACGSAPAAATATAAEPVTIEAIGDTGVKRLTLTDKAVERLAITTAPVTEDLDGHGAATGKLLIPYSALLYLPDGTTIAYTNPDGHELRPRNGHRREHPR